MAKPSPLPGLSFESLKNGLNISFKFSLGIPGPVSWIVTIKCFVLFS